MGVYLFAGIKTGGLSQRIIVWLREANSVLREPEKEIKCRPAFRNSNTLTSAPGRPNLCP